MTVQAIVLLVHAVTTVLMTGLIWFVQVVHYPLMKRISKEEFIEYEREHMRRTTWVVAPLMLLEAGSAMTLPVFVEGGTDRILAWFGLILLLAIWASTACLQVPCHRRLSSRFDATAIQRLIQTNWIRTIAWTLRTTIATAVLFTVLSGSAGG